MILSALKKFLSPKKKSPIRRQMKNPAFRVETLEDRTVPSSVTVSPGGSIQAAINAAASGTTIEVSAGTYAQTVVIPSSKTGISLVAEGTVILQPTTVSSLTLNGLNVGGAAIDVYGTSAVVNGFTVDGSQETDGDLYAGIRVIDGGSATIKNDTVENVTDAAAGTDANIGIQVGDALVSGSAGGGTAKVNNNTVFNYAGAGVIVDGSYSAASVKGNTITGRGTANYPVVEYGVQVSDGATGRVQGNTISENTLLGQAGAPNNPAPTSAGIFVCSDSGKNTVVAENCVTMNDDGILVQLSNGSNCDGIQIVNNDVHQNYGYAGIFVLSSTNVEVSCNDVSCNLTYNGIAMNYSSNVLVNSNDVYGNGVSNSGTDGIYDFSGSCNQILANNSYGNTGNGINIQSTNGDSLFNNVTWNNTFSGIQDYQGSNDAIWLGAAVNNNSDGIFLYQTTSDTVVGNVLALNEGYGLHLIGAKNTFIAENLIVGNESGNVFIDSTSSGTVMINNWTNSPPTKDGSSGMHGNSNSFNNSFADADNACSGLCD
ncbi:MAG TPA: right-handed parallel beta-helix repeat-containing protein [Gemmata sp.]|nr:right-handed parallel beta-helix repeat-containing protein [Gemmata sp.]